MNSRLHFAFAVLLAATALNAQTASGRTQVSPDGVVAALNFHHLPVEKSQIRLLSEVVTRSRGGMLQVVEVERWNDLDALVKLRCARSGDCLPFFVALHWPTAEDRDLALTAAREKGTVRAGVRKEMLVRAGQKATLIVSNSRFHATTPIVCLEAGGQGQRVRVATLDHKKIARAEVIDSGVLRGSF